MILEGRASMSIVIHLLILLTLTPDPSLNLIGPKPDMSTCWGLFLGSLILKG